MNRFKESFRRLNARDLMGEIAGTIAQQMALRDALDRVIRGSSVPVLVFRPEW